jgi:hypothetical protein
VGAEGWVEALSKPNILFVGESGIKANRISQPTPTPIKLLSIKNASPAAFLEHGLRFFQISWQAQSGENLNRAAGVGQALL